MSTLKHHHISFKQGPATGGSVEWEGLIKKVNGVTKVSIDGGKCNVYVEYDIVKCCEEAIEHWMVNSGFVLDDSFMERFKRGWVHYTEENERDALTAKPTSCCDVEEIERKRKAKK
jgi:hypothetical protein